MPKNKGKGKAPKGRAGAKQKSQKAQKGGSGPSPAFVRAAREMPGDEDSSFKGFRGFAQAGPRNFSSQQNPTVKLRHQAISFVSAGNNATMKQEEDEIQVEDTYVAEDSDDEEVVDFKGDLDGDDTEDGKMQTNIAVDTDLDISEGAIAQMNIHSSAEMTGPDTDCTSSDVDMLGAGKGAKEASAEPLPFVVDTMGDESLAFTSKADGKKPVIRDSSPARSDSSDEVVVFHGRKTTVVNDPIHEQPVEAASPKPLPHQKAAQTNAQKAPARKAEPVESEHVADSLLAALEDPPNGTHRSPSPAPDSNSIPARGWPVNPSEADEQINNDAMWAPAPAGSWWRKSKQAPPAIEQARPANRAIEGDPGFSSKVNVQATATRLPQDTTESLRADWKQALRERKKGKHSANDAMELDSGASKSNRRGKRGRKKDNKQLRDPITSSDDEAGEAAYDDYMSNLKAQIGLEDDDEGDDQALASATRAFASSAAGCPSLVVNGKEIGEDELLTKSGDEWIDDDSSEPGSDSDSDVIIGQDIDELSLRDDDLEDSTDLEEDLEYNEREQWEDEEDLRRRRQEAMSDEQIARLLAKQEQFGIEGDEIVLDDGDYPDSGMDGIGDVEMARAGLADMSNFASSSRAFKRGGGGSSKAKKGPVFPDATALADTVDQYGAQGFDIMDFDRPSLGPKRKGRKGAPPPELAALSDDSLAADLHAAWDNDRATKRTKKAEREALRADGLLSGSGKKPSSHTKPDLNFKYPSGMTLPQILAELRIFMQDDALTTRPFPPMDKRDRKHLHEVAQALNLKSKSVGSGKARFPVLYKTQRTPPYSAPLFDRLTRGGGGGRVFGSGGGRGGRGKQPRAGFGGGGKRGGAGGGGRGGGFDNAAVSLRHGEVVGAGAQVIGAESFGSKMMERMGWSRGMALGKEGEGRLNPVEQVMRSGKAGLG